MRDQCITTDSTLLWSIPTNVLLKVGPWQWSKVMCARDQNALREISKISSWQMMATVLRRWMERGWKLHEDFKWAANPKTMIVHWGNGLACSSQKGYLGIASHEMPMRKSNRSSFIILFPVARKTLEVKLGTDIRFLRKCSQNSIKFQGSGVCVGEDYGPRSGSTVDIPSVLISREAHRENLQGDTATVTITQRFFRMPKSFVKPKNFTVLLLNAPQQYIFFFLHFSMKSTENYSDLLFTTSFEVFCGLKGIALFFFWSQPSTVLFQGKLHVYHESLFSLRWPSPNFTFGMAQGGQDFKPYNKRSPILASFVSWFVSLANAMKCKKQSTKHIICEESRDWHLRGIAKFFFFRALGFSVDSWEINHLTSRHFQPWWARWTMIAC